MSTMNIGNKIRELRQKNGYTLLEISEKLGVKEATVQRYESGNIKNLKQDTIGKLADILHTTPAYLMGWEEKEKPTNKGELQREVEDIFNNLPSEKQDQALAFLRFLQGK